MLKRNLKVKVFAFCVVFFSTLITYGQDEITEKVLFTVDTNKVQVDEFLYVYSKNQVNNNEKYGSPEDIQEYLDLFINFKLKVTEAYHLGLDTTEAFKQEYKKYKDQLIKPYLAQSKVVANMAEEAYERMKEQVRASHLLIRVNENASPEDTLKAYNKIKELRDKAVQGENFDSLAYKYSEDPSAKVNYGDLGYFTALQMVYPFENAAFSTKVGEVSKIVRTRFGYHILKVKDKKPNPGTVKVAHIFVRSPREDGDARRDEILQIYDQLNNKVSWDDLCKQYSEDERTKSSGGELAYFGPGQMPDEFEKVSFSLAEKGDVSDPFRTDYGWHIVKLIDKKGLPEFDELKNDLEIRVRRDMRSEVGQKETMEHLKSTLGYHLNEDVLDGLKTYAKTNGENLSGFEKKSQELIRVYNKSYTVDDFLAYLETNASARPGDRIGNSVEEYEERLIMKAEEKLLDDTNRDFHYLMNEYKEGLLLFDIMEKEVWNKAQQDSVGLAQFYEKNKQNYMYGNRTDVQMVYSNDTSILAEAKKIMSSGGEIPFAQEEFSISIDSVLNNKMLMNPIARKVNKYDEATVKVYYPQGADDSELQKLKEFSEKLFKKEFITKYIEQTDNTIKIEASTPSLKALEDVYNKENNEVVKVLEGKFEKGENDLVDKNWEVGKHTFVKDGWNYILNVDAILSPSPKPLKEIKGVVISDYQGQIEKDWIGTLKAKYNVDLSKKIKKKTFKYFEDTI